MIISIEEPQAPARRLALCTMPVTAESVPAQRRFARQTARCWHVPAAVEEALSVVATELVTNVLLHSGSPHVALLLRLDGATLTVEVRDAALQNAGYRADDVIGVGLGAYLACKSWASGKPSGMKAALFINGGDVGALAVQTMYDKLKNGKEFPKEAFAPTKMVDASNWQAAGVTCS